MAAALLVSLALAGCGGTPSPSPSPSASSAAPSTIDRVGVDSPVGIVAIDDAVWVASAGDGAVVRIDVATHEVTETVEVGETPLRLAYDGTLLWASVFGEDTVVAIDPSSGEVVVTVPLEGQPEGLAVGFGSVWVVRQAARELTRLGPDGAVQGSFPLGQEPRLVAVSDAYVFASNFGAGTVTRLDPATGELATSEKLCDGAQGLAADAEVLWVTCTTEDLVLAVDPSDLSVIGRLDLPGEPDAVHVVDGVVWVAVTDGPALVRIGGEPSAPVAETRRTLASAAPLSDRANVDFVVVGGDGWVTSPRSDAVYVGAAD